MNREFYADRPNENWLTDVTAFKYYDGPVIKKLYLSAFLDLYDRRIVAYKPVVLGYLIYQTVSGKLSWSHYCELLSITDENKRSFYEKESINSGWSVRELKRQIDSSLYERLLLSSGDANKEKVLFLAQKGIDKKDVNINQSIDFGSTAAAFSGGQGDYTIEFEPSATLLEQKGDGYVVASVGTESGYVPYTSYSVKQSYLKTHGATVEKFTKALQKGMDFVQTHTPEEIAEVIAPQFAETELETITAIVRRYYEQDTWKENLIFKKGTVQDTRDNKIRRRGRRQRLIPAE